MALPQTESRNVRSVQVLLNFTGLIAPLVAGFFAIPILLTHLGAEKFGLLTLFWVLIGYANIFELGLGRSITRMLSAFMEDISRQSRIISTGLLLSAVLGLVGMLVVWFGFPLLFTYAIELSPQLSEQAIRGTRYVALALPVLIASPILLGILEAHHRFGLISLIRIPTGILLFAVPAIVATTDTNVAVLVQSMLFIRIASILVQFATVALVTPLQRSQFGYSGSEALQLLTFGGWLTVSAIIGPLLVYADRFVLASYRTLEETAVYTTPFEAVVRFLVIPAAILGVFFPRFVAHHVSGSGNLRALYKEANIVVFLAVLPLPIIMWFYGASLLGWWLQQGDTERMAYIAFILSVALLLNASAHVPQAYVQATGRADWTGKLHFVELVLWGLYIPKMIAAFGPEGAAYGWLVRVVISTVVLFSMAAYLMWKSNHQR